MIKPNKLEIGDKIALVSLSSGIIGEDKFAHKYELAKKRLKEEFGLELVPMPNSLKGTDYIYEHPEKRAEDLMQAFKDEEIKGIFCALGGDDTIRILPYIDFDVITANPKIFLGYSDTTINHFMMHKAGLASFYGPCVMAEFGEYGKIFDYTKQAVLNTLFSDYDELEIKPSEFWSKDYVLWEEKNINVEKNLIPDEHGYEVLQGTGVIEGEILGGCIEVFQMCVGTKIWPTLDEWKNKILLIETSEDKPDPVNISYTLRNLGAMGILNAIQGIIVGKPQGEVYYEEYKEIIVKTLKEYKCENLPVLYNVNIGHAQPIGILPLGSKVGIDFNNKLFSLIESPTKTINHEKTR